MLVFVPLDLRTSSYAWERCNKSLKSEVRKSTKSMQRTVSKCVSKSINIGPRSSPQNNVKKQISPSQKCKKNDPQVVFKSEEIFGGGASRGIYLWWPNKFCDSKPESTAPPKCSLDLKMIAKLIPKTPKGTTNNSLFFTRNYSNYNGPAD